jgi:mRNA interferase MazF
MLKKFLDWIGLKEKIHTTSVGPLYFKEGEIWWCAIGENIGVEINGKGKMFSRPIFVYKKLSKAGFIGIPLSTQSKEGTWYISFSFQNKNIVANLAQVRFFSTFRLYKKMGALDDSDIGKIKSGFLRLYS